MLAHRYSGAAKPRCCGYTTQRFRWPKRASHAPTLSSRWDAMNELMHSDDSCGAISHTSSVFRYRSYGEARLRLLWPRRTAVRAVVWAIALFDTWSHQEHSATANQAIKQRHADLQQQAYQYFLQQHRQAFTTCCPTSSVIEASCLVLVCQGYTGQAKLRYRPCT